MTKDKWTNVKFATYDISYHCPLLCIRARRPHSHTWSFHSSSCHPLLQQAGVAPVSGWGPPNPTYQDSPGVPSFSVPHKPCRSELAFPAYLFARLGLYKDTIAPPHQPREVVPLPPPFHRWGDGGTIPRPNNSQGQALRRAHISSPRPCLHYLPHRISPNSLSTAQMPQVQSTRISPSSEAARSLLAAAPPRVTGRPRADKRALPAWDTGADRWDSFLTEERFGLINFSTWKTVNATQTLALRSVQE